MRVTLHHDGTQLETLEDEDVAVVAGLAQAALIRWHAAAPQAHFDLHIEGDSQKHPLVITCPQCRVSQEQEVEPWFVGAATVAFHTSHEGHPLRIEYAGRVLESPPRNAPRVSPQPLHVTGEHPAAGRLAAEVKASQPALLTRDRHRFVDAVNRFRPKATNEWATELIGEPPVEVTRVRVRPMEDQSGIGEDGRFYLYVQLVIRYTWDGRGLKMTFPHIEVSDRLSIPVIG